MQTGPGRSRRRGYRDSSELTEIAKSVPADLTGLVALADQNQTAFDALTPYVTTIAETDVAKVLRARKQLHFRLALRA